MKLMEKYGLLAGACAEGWARRQADPADALSRWTFQLLDLNRLLPLWPAEMADATDVGRQHILVRLKQALQTERRRADIGHWAYNPARHNAMRHTLKELKAIHTELGGAS